MLNQEEVEWMNGNMGSGDCRAAEKTRASRASNRACVQVSVGTELPASTALPRACKGEGKVSDKRSVQYWERRWACESW